jgi:hypothetical protein
MQDAPPDENPHVDLDLSTLKEHYARRHWGADSPQGAVLVQAGAAPCDGAKQSANVLPRLALPGLCCEVRARVLARAHPPEERSVRHWRNPRCIGKRVTLYVSPVLTLLTYGAAASNVAPSFLNENVVASSATGPIIGAVRSSDRYTR